MSPSTTAPSDTDVALDADEKERFSQSLRRCLDSPMFLDRFYERLLAASVEAREKFVHPRLTLHHRIKLACALYLIEMMADGVMKNSTALEQLAQAHSRTGRDIRPELYAVWVDCLIEAALEHDPLFDPALERLWRVGMQPTIRYMQSRY